MGTDDAEPFRARVERLAAARGMSIPDLRYLAYTRGVRGTNPETLKKVIAGERPRTIVAMRAIAKALQVEPEEFPEYRLAMAREWLDETQLDGGLEEALAHLRLIEDRLT